MTDNVGVAFDMNTTLSTEDWGFEMTTGTLGALGATTGGFAGVGGEGGITTVGLGSGVVVVLCL
jgi:hypothetical protein